jgi:hypothetical protein
VEGKKSSTELERRSKTRYPVTLTVRYRTMGRFNRTTGMGRTVNISSSGLLVSSTHRAEVGTRVEINIEWPSMLDGQIPLQLVAVGRVVRCLESGFALSFAQYQFRTMSRKTTLPNDSVEPEPVFIRSAGA